MLETVETVKERKKHNFNELRIINYAQKINIIDHIKNILFRKEKLLYSQCLLCV